MVFGLISSIFGGGGSSSDAAATNANDVSFEPETTFNNTVNTNIDFTQAGQLISGSLDGFNQEVAGIGDSLGTAGTAISSGLGNLTKTVSAIALIGLIGSTLKK